MFNPSRDQARQFFFDTWDRHRQGRPLEPLQQKALAVILLHPEYHRLLEQPERHMDRDYLPEAGDLNPFLHLSLHLAVDEQLSIDQPSGIRAQFERLRTDFGTEHDALHAVVDCLGETIWQAQRAAQPPDAQFYLDCLRARGRK
jgi:hypothetical protein